jgi:hypothetical protein
MEAIAGRRDMERLYETSRRILLLDSTGRTRDLITSLIREIFDSAGGSLFDAQSGQRIKAASDAGGGRAADPGCLFVAATPSIREPEAGTACCGWARGRWAAWR